MSTRYVWKQYTSTIKEDTGYQLTITDVPLSTSLTDTTVPNAFLIASPKYRLDYDESGVLNYYPSGSWEYLQVLGDSKFKSKDATQWPYIIVTGPDSNQYGKRLFVSLASASNHPFWYAVRITDDKRYLRLYNANTFDVNITDNEQGGADLNGPVLSYESRDANLAKVSKTYKGYISNSSRSAYPDDGMDSSRRYYYEYAGSDNIDPTSVSYSGQNLNAGESVKVSVTPRSNTYGGTIYYQYSYSTNGGASWVSSGNATTDTSKTITIPEGATEFQVRVQASDNMGFASSDYVSGPNVSVSSVLAYIGVNGKARKVSKIYVGVNGKARLAKKVYVGVNGKARRYQ